MPILTPLRCWLLTACLIVSLASCSSDRKEPVELADPDCSDQTDNTSTDAGQDSDDPDCGGDGGDGGDGDGDGPILDDDPTLGAAVDSKATPKPNEPFSKFQLANSLYTNNVYDGRAQLEGSSNQLFYSDGTQDFVSWNIPTATELGDNRDSCGAPHGNDNVVLNYRITSRKDTDDRFNFVRAFPAMVVGTMGGRFESWGVECNDSSKISDSYGRKDSPAFDMTAVKSVTGFPTLANDLPGEVKISVKSDIHNGIATNGIANVFLDTYWHDVSSIEKIPGQDAQWLNTIDGINSDFTESWNLNIWFDWSNIDNRTIRQWTGGIPLGSVQIEGNPEFDIYLKAEGRRDDFLPTCRTGEQDNCFMYIALAVKDRLLTPEGVTINYSEIANWMRSSDFRDLFLDGADIQDTSEPSAIAYNIWRTIDGPQNDSQPDAAKRGPRFPDIDHVIGGLHLGSEIWFNPQGEEAELEFETFGISVNGIGTFGRYVDYTQP